eukprot:Gregarina_sp_Pseudo_9__2140@NODE_2495_length_979_cov_148_284043_g2296_i0_p1_GENE_NODE_2495_length_979_cov_148_284043_g2296_i0NODE_2495_length_979_cov_148_284043_g2296_i0_p1_ORF_typecomplete_len266_score54_69Acetyltransf_3/PF13302_7/2_1e13Acetyltransf_10/PF13673_7/0_15_NODE_2495_length_979_cov_148_284043_g2296_i090887
MKAPEECIYPLRVLENDRVKLIPFDLEAKHHELFFLASKPYPELFKYLSSGPFESAQDLVDNFYMPNIHRPRGSLLWLVVDKTQQKEDVSPTHLTVWLPEGALAGCIGFVNSSAMHSKTEIGYVITLPPFQRTHVTTNAVGLLMHYALDLPLPEGHTGPAYDGAVPLIGGNGLRRCQWQADATNESSKNAALRVGMTFEGVLRWVRIVPTADRGHNQKVFDSDDPRGAVLGRDMFMAATCWDEWEGQTGSMSVRQHVDQLMARRS